MSPASFFLMRCKVECIFQMSRNTSKTGHYFLNYRSHPGKEVVSRWLIVFIILPAWIFTAVFFFHHSLFKNLSGKEKHRKPLGNLHSVPLVCGVLHGFSVPFVFWRDSISEHFLAEEPVIMCQSEDLLQRPLFVIKQTYWYIQPCFPPLRLCSKGNLQWNLY